MYQLFNTRFECYVFLYFKLMKEKSIESSLQKKKNTFVNKIFHISTIKKIASIAAFHPSRYAKTAVLLLI